MKLVVVSGGRARWSRICAGEMLGVLNSLVWVAGRCVWWPGAVEYCTGR